MIAAYPYNTWPLHVKLFTEEAVKHWTNLSQTVNLPEGLTLSVELEGVDGKSGMTGSGRTGPIDVSDGIEIRRFPWPQLMCSIGVFTDAHLKKAGKLAADPVCTICAKAVHDVAQVSYCMFASPAIH